MRYATHVEGLIGHTPLADLTALCASPAAGVRILGKYEAANPGGSVKDRIARAMLDAAEASGALVPGGTIIEPTSGNTGIGLAMLAAVRGYEMILVMPDTMSVERRKLAASYGARIELTPGVQGMAGAVQRAAELESEIEGAIVAGQFTNPANPLAHYQTTGPELWDDTDGAIDILVAGVGTGGTITGSARYLKERKPGLLAVAVEPAESPVLSGGTPGAHRIQGIGAGFVPEVFDANVVDEIATVTSPDAIAMRARLAEEAGLLVGISSGAAMAAACKVAERDDSAGKTIVAILPDTGERYLSMEL